MKYILYICFNLILFLNVAQATQDTGIVENHYMAWDDMEDIKNIPQDIDTYLKELELTESKIKSNVTGSGDYPETMNQFKKDFTAVWNLNDNNQKKLIDNMIEYYRAAISGDRNVFYGFHYHKYDKELIDSIYDNINPNLNSNNLRPAIITRSTDSMALPTNLPNYELTTGGNMHKYYPLDINRRTILQIGSPVVVIDYSKDRQYVLVFSFDQSGGWIDARNFAFISKKQIKDYNSKNFAINTKFYEHVGLHSPMESFGAILPMTTKNELLSPTSDLRNNLKWSKAASNTSFKKLPLEFNADNIKAVVNQLYNKPYGWGLLHGFFDCSAMTRAFYSAFGLWIPRNSKAQSEEESNSNIKQVFDVERFTSHEKQESILQNAIPFRTILYFPGHVAIYVGQHNGKPIIFHATWGKTTYDGNVKTTRIIGRAIFSGLEYKSRSKDTNLLDSLTKIIVL